MLRFILSVFLPVMLVVGCASSPPPRKATVSERIEFDRAIGSELADQMDRQLTYKKDPLLQAYLGKVAQRLVDKNPELHLAEVKVVLFQDSGHRYRSYALPGGKIYLSVGALKATEYENEIAALIAIELGHLMKEHVQDYLRKNPAGLRVRDATSVPGGIPLKTLESPEDIDFFGNEGMFAFNAKENDEAVESAVQFMYDAGYDPRGMVTFLQSMDSLAKHAPWDDNELSRLLDGARRTIALQTPLLNPIVQTDTFVIMRPKLRKL